MRIGVLALQGDVREHLAVLGALGVEAYGVRRAEELERCDGLVLPGGESTTVVRLARVFDLLEPLRQRVKDGMPVLGTCAGMILLADRILDGAPGQETLGGMDMVVRRNAFGRQVASFEEQLLLTPAGEEPISFPATFIRAPWVEEVGAGVEVLGRVVDAPHGDRIVAVRQGPLLATSFHPEVTGDPRLHQLFVRTAVRYGSGQGPVPARTRPRTDSSEGRDSREDRMSGHSKWATTKHKKAAIDARRGKLFAKLTKNIEVAARMGGGDPSANPTLYDAIQKAKKSSVPGDNIDRAVKRGSGAEGGGVEYQTQMYEGYGPQGVAVLVECLTDNKNRAAMEVRTAMNRSGGSMADAGSVSFLFNRKGVLVVPAQQAGATVDEDQVLEATLEAGAEEVLDHGETFEVLTDPSDLVAVRQALQAAGLDYDSAEPSFLPDMKVELDAEGAGKVFRLLDALEDLDDVQNLYANYQVPDRVIEQLDAS